MLFEDKIKTISRIFVSILSFLFVILILYLNVLHTTFTFADDYPLIAQNPIISSLIKAMLGVFIIAMISFIGKYSHNKVLFSLIVIVNLVSLGLKIYIVYSFKNYPTIDPYQIYNGAMILHYTQDLKPLFISNYFAMFPQQLGLVTILTPFIAWFGESINNYYVTQAILSQLTLILFTLSSYKLKGMKSAFSTTLLLALFIPNLFISFLIYGDGYALFFIALFMTLFVYFGHLKSRAQYSLYGVLYGLLSLAYLARLSSNVIIIAFAGTLFILSQWNLKLIIKMGLLLSILVVPMYLNLKLYDHPEVELGKYAHPTNTWIRIGLGYGGGNGLYPGVNNNDTNDDFMVLGYDPQKMSALNTTIIHHELTVLSENYVWFDFFKQKLSIMWTDPDFELMTLILPSHVGKIKAPWKLLQTGNYGFGAFNLVTTNAFGDWLQKNYFKIRSVEKVVYFGFLVATLLLFLKRNSKEWPLWFLRLSLIGFVLLHGLIEVKSRYVFGFVNILIFVVSLYNIEIMDDVVIRVQNYGKFIKGKLHDYKSSRSSIFPTPTRL